LFFALLGVVGCAPPTADWPPVVDRLITEFETSSKTNPPASIWRYEYRGLAVFYVPPSCCDIPGELYDSNGNLICGPDGGISGRGDGRCPDFFRERTEELRVWADDR
jgi:hypothetical protein